MKRKSFYCVLICVIFLLSGCRSTEESIIETGKETQTAEKQENEIKKQEEADPVSLNVENDIFTFDELIQLIGKEEKSALILFDLDKKAETYKSVLFGEEVEITLETESETIQAIQIVFGKTDQELLDNAISEQLGRDGEEKEEKVTWKLENGNVVLCPEEDGCRVMIEK